MVTSMEHLAGVDCAKDPACEHAGLNFADVVTGRLLDRLLKAFPGLKWSRAALGELYAALGNSSADVDADEDSGPQGGLAAGRRTGTLQRLTWVSKPVLSV